MTECETCLVKTNCSVCRKQLCSSDQMCDDSSKRTSKRDRKICAECYEQVRFSSDEVVIFQQSHSPDESYW